LLKVVLNTINQTKSKKSSPKPLSQMNRNLVGSILGRSSIKILFSSDPLTNMAASIGASHQVSIHLAKQFQRRFLEIDQPETRMAYGSHVC
jgi:hypothetical protein